MTGFNVHGARTNQVSQSEMLPLKLDFKLLIIFCFAPCITFTFITLFRNSWNVLQTNDVFTKHLKKIFVPQRIDLLQLYLLKM